ncbi:vezatin isoform X3 [Erpetoichthys calabaricus]|uniref:vezatin isoform X3 n=1 Tax=Erpetoichthys calabaricus TaxID=27687 RepID=UPI00109F3550|nr:vezatin isoform X3 [Erpetoichthys calabaricus]
MTEEFDEENSPLFQYLQDLGHTDFETCPAVSQEAEQYAEDKGLDQQDTHIIQREGFFLKLAEIILWWSPFIHGKTSFSPELKLDMEFRYCSLNTIFEQEVLLQEDVELIELLDPSIMTTRQDQQAENGKTSVLRVFAALNLWDYSCLAAFFGMFIGLYILPECSSWLVFAPCFFFFIIYLVSRGLGLWKMTRLQMKIRRCSQKLEELAANSRAFTNLVRKALRLVQETEVISRGFTLLLDRVSAACPFSKASQLRSQQLIGLRKAVYKALRASFRAARLATCHMLKSYPLNSEIDNITNYVSMVPLKELGLGLCEENLSDEQIQELTDDYSLPTLKVLFQLWVGQSSEFYRRLALLLSPAQSYTDSGKISKHLMYQVVSEVTGSVYHTMTVCLDDLRRSYEFHRYFEMQHQPHGNGERFRKAGQKCRDLNSLYTAVRSLQLHLKAFLNEVIILEDDLEKMMVTKDPEEKTCSLYLDLEQKLSFIHPHMKASTSCWEEAVSLIDKMVRRGTDPKGKSQTPDESFPPVLTPASYTITHIEDRDPVPEEQELEAYVEDCDSDRENHSDSFDYMSPEEREQQKREREESRRVLQELKSVLGLRASEMERQKWKQLLFSEQAVLKPLEMLTPDGTSDLQLIENPTSSQNGEDENAQQQVHKERDSCTECTSKAAISPVEYCCGHQEGLKNQDFATAPSPLHYQYDGTQDTTDDEVDPEPCLSSTVKNRLIGLHGSAGISFTSSLAALAAARSHDFCNMQEQTFGDDDEEEVEEDGDGNK